MWLKAGLVHEWNFPAAFAVVCLLAILLLIVAGYACRVVVCLILWDSKYMGDGRINSLHFDFGFIFLVCFTVVGVAFGYLHGQYNEWYQANIVVTILDNPESDAINGIALDNMNDITDIENPDRVNAN